MTPINAIHAQLDCYVVVYNHGIMTLTDLNNDVSNKYEISFDLFSSILITLLDQDRDTKHYLRTMEFFLTHENPFFDLTRGITPLEGDIDS